MLQETNARSIPLPGSRKTTLLPTLVEADRNQRRCKKKYVIGKKIQKQLYLYQIIIQEPTFALYIDILTKALYHIQRRDSASLELDPAKFERMIEATNPQLKAKPVIESYSVQLTSNGVSVHNPENVETSKICWYLLNVYTGAFDISYTDRQSYKISQGLIINTFDPIEMLTIHSYADNIVERKEERSMRGLQLVEFREQHLHSQAYIIMDHDPVFKDTYAKTRRYPYNATTLDFLYEKMALFLLQYFQDVFHNRGKSIPNSQQKNYRECQENKPTKKTSKKKPPEIYQLATLNEEVDLRYLLTAYSTSHPPYPKLCDCCGLPLSDDNSMKKGIFENVNLFLKRIEKGENKLTKEDLDDDENDIEESVRRK
ncbi:hypothetical protein C2G38_2240004 [Gigaspora rosea]|uniref:Uncharacterized protein n=1 Tax=Gigaspora rosea TaxID=44941 RepID=A0A397VYP7_9GLOM|nr:hypothetical protein C2G38_2240004 [Gigaspora rosea]